MIYIAFLFHLVWYKNSNFRGVSGTTVSHIEGKSCAAASSLRERENKAQPQRWRMSRASESNGPFVRLCICTYRPLNLLPYHRRRWEYFIGDRIYPVRKGDRHL